MSYSEPLINQIKVLFMSIGIGMLLGALYTLLQGAFRLFGKGKVSYYLADGLFSAAFLILSFFFMVLYNNGRVRIHLIFGEGAGFFLFYYSMGRYLYVAFEKAALVIRNALRLFIKPYTIIFTSFCGGIKRSAINIYRKMQFHFRDNSVQSENNQKKDKKFKLFGKIHLKNPNK